MTGFKKNLQITEEKSGFFGRLRQGLSKTGEALTGGMGSLVLGHKTLDDDLLEDIETRLLTADVGVDATQKIIQDLTQRLSRSELGNLDTLYQALGESMYAILEPCEKPLQIDTSKAPFVLLVAGINGAGKTTTIGKLAHHYKSAGHQVILAAGDTFRAAAVEQLQTWGERNDVPVIAQSTGSDSASVIFDALQSARARGMDILIADTAGRLHTQENLMDELKKIKRVLGKLDETAPHETLLVVDGGTGQNAIRQTEAFHEAIKLDGLVVTKLDGTAKGGVLFALSEKFGLPIRYIGVGEAIEDLRVFDAEEFINAILQDS